MTGLTLYTVMSMLSMVAIDGIPTLSFSSGLPSFTFRPVTKQPEETQTRAQAQTQITTYGYKPYSEIRVQNDSFRMVYFNMQTVAIVELGPGKLLLNCELIEVYEATDAVHLLNSLSKRISKPLAITFAEMMTLMGQCQMLDSLLKTDSNRGGGQTATIIEKQSDSVNKGLIGSNPLTIFSGIIPGTKWCGTGDIADTYHDLGRYVNLDKCCRTHDLCPMKVRAYTNRYNLTNESIYSKSHCQCDDNLYKCLKDVGSATANLMGNVYFNIIQVPCIEELMDGTKKFSNTKNSF